MDGAKVAGRATALFEDGSPGLVGPPWHIVGVGEFDFLARAQAVVRDCYRRTGGSLGPLGEPIGALKRGDGIARQEYLLGSITLSVADLIPKVETHYEAKVKLAAVKCFGTEDPGGTDETYVVVSLTAIDPNRAGSDQLVQTFRTEIDNNVEGGKVFFKERNIGAVRAFPGSGIRVHVAIFDHESGDANQIRDKIHAFLKDAAKQGAQLLAGAAAGGDPRLAGALGDVTNFEIGGVKPFELLTFGLSDLIANALADDLIGEHEFVIPAPNIVELTDPDRFTASFRRHPETLGSDVQFNWPRTDADEVLFSGGGGSYKVYLTITPVTVTEPTQPGLP
ncbi:hypothetical protein ABZ926_14880, partial [Streptomyces litmocidini]|uniref:hypothetical protein n=1 Tax=Streptomyces litmocidini TaxID=67318 RepID=UPI0033F9ED57